MALVYMYNIGQSGQGEFGQLIHIPFENEQRTHKLIFYGKYYRSSSEFHKAITLFKVVNIFSLKLILKYSTIK